MDQYCTFPQARSFPLHKHFCLAGLGIAHFATCILRVFVQDSNGPVDSPPQIGAHAEDGQSSQLSSERFLEQPALSALSLKREPPHFHFETRFVCEASLFKGSKTCWISLL